MRVHSKREPNALFITHALRIAIDAIGAAVWNRVDDPKVPLPHYEWLLVQLKAEPEGHYMRPRIAEFRQGKWYCQYYPEPIEEKLGAKVTHWIHLPKFDEEYYGKK